ncbi:hypothetical protein BDP27DRAFT_1430284 [Rhodocollybia butyracea]|uniref:Protein transport protein SEC31 n=1 Tax=Rhodocollybia butyracea TaxID=206335 RepID=A0A9P5PBC6_9AGAR|nr:hypothetical protein BDP27DRAFT_1430284 [Rhodocollybia butyracea]
MKLKEIHRTSTFAWSPYASLPLLATGTVAGALDESFSNESQLEIWAPDFLDKHEYDLGGQGHNGPKGVVTDTARFNRITWGYVDSSRPRGVIAAGMENGELSLWDPAKILAGESSANCQILRNSQHTGPIRALDFNPIQTSLLSSGGIGGEVYIWDLKDPSKPYTPTPGSRSTKLDEITSVAWNQQVQYVLAGASSTGYTVVWDLRGKREVVALAYGGGAGTLAGQSSHGNGLAVGGRRGMSAIAWHPDNATRLVTASEDDSSPIIMAWDLRNARAPEKILTGHEKGVLSLSWCKQDADLLLSCGKDNRVLCWNPQSSEIIGELPSADNWAFQVEWCPRNPDLLASAFFDGTVGIHSIQSTNESSTTATSTATPSAAASTDGSDIFDVPGFARSSQGGTLSLKQPPKWLRRPVSSSFGFGGKLVSISNLAGARGENQSRSVHLRGVVTEEDVVGRARALQTAVEGGEGESIRVFAEGKVKANAEEKVGESEEEEIWNALLTMYHMDSDSDSGSREELVTLLGYKKSDVAAKIGEAVEKLKAGVEGRKQQYLEEEDNVEGARDLADMKPPVVSFAEPEREPTPLGGAEPAETPDARDEVDEIDESPFDNEKTPSEISASVTSDTTRQVDTESTTTAPSLFGTITLPPEPQVLVPHTNYAVDSSVAATIGSRPSSAASASEVGSSKNNNTFRIIYSPSDDESENEAGTGSETEALITKALILGDFSSAVSLCLSTNRFADALLLAVRGGPALLAETQKAYFDYERQRTLASASRFRNKAKPKPYLRLYESIVAGDLEDVVQNAELAEWREVFVVLCTFAGREEFGGLVEMLGRRLEFEYRVRRGDVNMDRDTEDLRNGLGGKEAVEYRRYATLTYLAAARLERLVSIWMEEMGEEEEALVRGEKFGSGSRYTAHAHALQSFVEKVTVFRSATKYEDVDLGAASNSNVAAEVKTYKLAGLYDQYFEYAELLASQGLLKEAAAVLKLTPPGYLGSSGGKDLVAERKRLSGATDAARATAVPVVHQTAAASTSRVPYGGGYGQPATVGRAAVPPAPVPAASGPYGGGYQPSANYHVQPQSQYSQNGAVGAQSYGAPSSVSTFTPAGNGFTPAANTFTPAAPSYNPYGGNMNTGSQVQPAQVAPPRVPATLPPPPKKRQCAMGNKAVPAAIVSPFPNSTASPLSPPTSGSYMQSGQPPMNLQHAPPRPGSVPGRAPPPAGPPGRVGPPGPGMYPPPPGAGARPPSVAGGGPGNMGMAPPPTRMMSPPQGHPPPPSQYGLPPTRGGPGPGQAPGPGPGQFGRPPQAGQAPHMPPPPSGPYARATPPPMQQPPSGPYAPPPGQAQAPAQGPGAYGPPPGQASGGGMHAPPPGARGGPPPQQHAPPPGAGPGGPPGRASPAAPPPRAQKAGPPPPKYPPGDRSHIPEHARPAYEVILRELERMKGSVPPAQKRQVDDLERRINPLFDALNCETLSTPVVDQLLVLTRAMDAHDRPAALAIHVDLLTRGSQKDDIGLWMSGVKQLIMRL